MSLTTYKKHIINVNLNEKVNPVNSFNCFNLKKFDIKKLKVNFTLKNTSNNKIIFFTHLIILEKIIGQKLKFVHSTEHNQNFNIRKGTILGCTSTITSKKIINFLFLFTNYSITKLNALNALSYSKSPLVKLKKNIQSFEF